MNIDTDEMNNMSLRSHPKQSLDKKPRDGVQDDVRFLPEAILGEILEYVSLGQRRLFFASCSFLWHEFRREYEADCRKLKGIPRSILNAYTPPSPSVALDRRSFFSGFHNLAVLDLGSKATDGFLRLMAPMEEDGSIATSCTSTDYSRVREELLPRLKHISMVRSKNITDRGLDYLSRGEHRAQHLESVDITFCSKTTYDGTFVLRDRLLNLTCIRRQPEWLDGSFVTPFGLTGEPEAEIHIYWADGTFSFNRSTQSSGFVCELFEWRNDDSNYLGDKLQYTDFQRPERWPEWCKYCYRPGVSLLRLQDKGHGESSSSDVVGSMIMEKQDRSVLVAQRLSGIRPPDDFPTLANCDVVPLGHSRFFDDRGYAIPALDDRDIPAATASPNATTMVSRMPVKPLPSGRLLPPDDIVQQNREFCAEMRQAVRSGIFMDMPTPTSQGTADEDEVARRMLEAGESVLDMALSQRR